MPNAKILTINNTDYDLKDEKGRLGTAAEFSTSANYVVGDYCWYEDKLYRFTADHSSSSWTAAHATEVNIADELKNIDVETGDQITELKSAINSALPIGKALGAIASFIDGADNVPVDDLKISIEPVQSGSGNPSPTNVRPITGWTGANVVRTGKNIMPVIADSTTKNGVTMTKNADGSFTFNGTATQESVFYLNSVDTTTPPTVLLKAGTYTLSGCPKGATGSGATYRLQMYRYYDGTYIGGSYYEYGSGFTFIAEDGDGYRPFIKIAQDYTCTNLTFKPQLEVGSTVTEYEPYTEATYSISFGSAGTVYGGTLDVTTGVLTVTHNNIRLTSTNQTWTATKAVGTGLRYYAIIAPAIDTNAADILCSHAVYLAGNEGNWGTYNLYNGRFAIKNNDGGAGFTSLADFKTWLDSQNFQICYPLATPQTYQLTSTEVRTLLGINNIWADTGDTEVEYRADTTRYIDRRINAQQRIISGVETSYTATKNYSIGDYVIVNDTLYKVTTAIASGATITPGTNCVATTVAEQLILLANA